eukprot:CAMPEP_0202742240 /NCGR_PEP_ID=MMETSP1388-20130828/4885_1 /ASSEMBLY_ACC=CAM_ASM_000864 /TAXON_ID=37098 /ORGANISM="Isochrysis sp, Strain CCMP1244" /LENGTH=536 /DNA_ID=CAMNT_0049409139 /DNA_START=58 /DNA_END=1668 /DNA_ORIENTATION=+
MPDDEPFKRYTPDELTQIFLAGGAQAEDLRAAQLEWKARMAAAVECIDTKDWDNGEGQGCQDYSEYCQGGGFRLGSEWAGGERYHHPEHNCCVCGKPLTGEYDAIHSARGEFAAELGEAVARPQLHTTAEDRVAACSARRRRNPEPQLLLFTRLPRVGNSLACALLSACAARQSRTACVSSSAAAAAALDAARPSDVPAALSQVSLAGACPGGASAGFLQYGADRLSPENRSMCAGFDGLSPACSGFGGDVGRSCAHLRTMRLPATAMVQYERYMQPESPPCVWLQAPVALLALLRDPGERAQSAFHFGLQACVCNFRFQWCKQFTSFRFSNRRGALCDNHKPKPTFYEGVSLLRARTNGQPFEVQTTDAAKILGRYTEGMVREVYVPYFGAHAAAPAAPPPRNSKGIGQGPMRRLPPPPPPPPLEHSASLAKLTLSHCYAWVGIVEELDLSLALLKAELPHFFRNLDPRHEALKWAPRSGVTENRSFLHPYLRSHLLAGDYSVYDAERGRLLKRAQKAGLAMPASGAAERATGGR